MNSKTYEKSVHGSKFGASQQAMVETSIPSVRSSTNITPSVTPYWSRKSLRRNKDLLFIGLNALCLTMPLLLGSTLPSNPKDWISGYNIALFSLLMVSCALSAVTLIAVLKQNRKFIMFGTSNAKPIYGALQLTAEQERFINDLKEQLRVKREYIALSLKKIDPKSRAQFIYDDFLSKDKRLSERFAGNYIIVTVIGDGVVDFEIQPGDTVAYRKLQERIVKAFGDDKKDNPMFLTLITSPKHPALFPLL